MNDPPTVNPPWAGEAHSSERHGTADAECDAEPVQTPGYIQGHGALLVLRPGDLTILQASENSAAWLGLAPARLRGAPVAVAVGAECEARLRGALRDGPVEGNPLCVHTLSAREGVEPLDVTVHTADGWVLVEFEAAGRGADPPWPDGCALVKKTSARWRGASTLHEFCRWVTEEIRQLTGFDRVMVYRFHADGHGEVFAESHRANLPPWLGLHYPAGDIPVPAREVFQKSWISPLPDTAAPPMALVPPVNPDTGRPVDLGYCALRGASARHTEYLRGMGVAAALAMAIRCDGRLWGLIACHHSTPTRFPYRRRAVGEFLAQVVSLQIKAVEDREHLAYRARLEEAHGRLIAAVAEEGGLEALVGTAHNLLDGIEAGGAALYHRDRWWRVGQAPDDAQLDLLAAWLAGRPGLHRPARPVYATDALALDYPLGVELAGIASGVLAVSLGGPRHLALWFRPETLQTVHWATAPGPHGPRPVPRGLCVESVRNRSVPWKGVEIEAALRLRLVIMGWVAGRAERPAVPSAGLARSNDELDAFAYIASHDLKEPLRGISMYASQLLTSATTALGEDDRRRLGGLMRLAERMDGLLDSLLHYSRTGRVPLTREAVDMNGVVEEALEMVAARRAGAQTDIVVPRPLPTVSCDRMRVREVFGNLIGNAIKYNDRPLRRVEIGYLAPGEPGGRPNAPQMVFYVRDNGIGIEPQHQARVFQIFRRLHGRDEYGGGAGVGLTIARRLVERHGGTLWLDSVPGVGSTFYFTLGEHVDGA